MCKGHKYYCNQNYNKKRKIITIFYEFAINNWIDDKDGNYINTYYQIWCNDKVSKMTSNELKKKITKVLISINGWLKVDVSEINGKKYTNMTIFPTSIEEYKKGS